MGGGSHPIIRKPLFKAHMIGWRIKAGFDASWSPNEALPNRLKPMHKTTRCPRVCVWILVPFFLAPSIHTSLLLQTRIGHQEYWKDLFCLESVGGAASKKTNPKKKKKKPRTQKVTTRGPSINAATPPNFGSPTRHIRTLVTHQSHSNSESIYSSRHSIIGGFLSRTRSLVRATNEPPSLTFLRQESEVKLTTTNFLPGPICHLDVWVSGALQSATQTLSVQDWSPHMSFICKGSQIQQPFGWRVGSNPRRRSKNIEMKYQTRIKLVHELYGTCFWYNVKN